MPFEFEATELPGVIRVRPRVFRDRRGRFLERYKRSAFREAGIEAEFVQDNGSVSGPGVLRGLHYQRPPRAQAKLVGVTRGTVFDVAVDLRAGSATYGQWAGEVLSAEEGTMLFVPEGFAHGFCALEEAAVHYKATAEYAPEHEGGVRWDDPDLAIEWPVAEPTLSDRDAKLPRLRDVEPGFGGDESARG